MSNRPAKLSRRILAAFIDFIIIYLCCYFVYGLLVNYTPLGAKIFEANEKYNNIYASYLNSLSMGSLFESEGRFYISWVSNLTSADHTFFNSTLMSNQELMGYYNVGINNTLIISLISVGLIELIFLFVIPFFNKKGQSIGKLITGLAVVDIRYDMYLDNKNKLIRFLVSFGIETCLLLLFFKDNGPTMVMFFAPLVVGTIIMTSQNKQALHDVLAHAKVVDLREATIFNSIEEKAEYDANLMNSKEEETEELENEVIPAEIIEKEEDN